jgi:hypothetical protein
LLQLLLGKLRLLQGWGVGLLLVLLLRLLLLQALLLLQLLLLLLLGWLLLLGHVCGEKEQIIVEVAVKFRVHAHGISCRRPHDWGHALHIMFIVVGLHVGPSGKRLARERIRGHCPKQSKRKKGARAHSDKKKKKESSWEMKK